MPTHSSDPPPDPPTDPPLFRPRATTLFRVLLVGVGGMLVSAAHALYQYYHSPYWSRVGLAPDQPVLFSHRHHAGELKIDCRFCHATVETSAFAGMPATQTCLGCHSQLFADTAMLQPVIQSAATGEPIPWTRVTRLPDHVHFNHGIHVAKGVSCATCHGDLGRMALTAKARRLDMRECLECHRDPGPRLLPREKIFAAVGSPSEPTADPLARPQISATHLTSCSTCHH